MAHFRLRGREIDAKEGRGIGIGRERCESQDRKEKQVFKESPNHVGLPRHFGFGLSYIWPFGQDHVIHNSMSEIKQTIEEENAGPGYRLLKTVVMVGMMGAGKTAVGKALAARLAVPFLDSDAEIEAAANMTIPEIFERDGEPFFRDKESQVIARLLEYERGILSTGGGAFLRADNREMIGRMGVSVCLRADLDVLWQRVRHKETRPLLQTENPRATLGALYEARVPLYAKADIIVQTDSQVTIEAMVDRVIEGLLTRPDVLERMG